MNKLPSECRERDPEVPYCIITGKYTVYMPGYNTVPLYDHMNENCPSEAPHYNRPNGC